MKKGNTSLAATLGTVAVNALIEGTPKIMDSINKKKEEKSFFDTNKFWIYIIILSVFVANLSYIVLFENTILNSIINIVYGVIVFILLCYFYFEVKEFYKTSTKLIKAATISIIILGIINSLCHVCSAIINLLV